MSDTGTDDELTGDERLVQSILADHVDETDFRIIRALNDDGRMSDTELGERVGLSRTAARRRRRKLQDEGILEVMAVIVLQEADLAYADVRVSLDATATQAERMALIDRLLDEELIYSIDSCLGEFDLFVRVWHEDLDATKTYLWELFEGEDCIKSYDVTPVVKTWKAWDKTLDEPSADE